MPREIPGFVYDADRGRYFRVQENHQNTQHVAVRSAPSTQPISSPSTSTNVSPELRRLDNDPRNGSAIAAPRSTIGARYTREVVDGQKGARDGDSSRRRRRKEREERKRLEYLASRHDHKHEHGLSNVGQTTHTTTCASESPSQRQPQPQPRPRPRSSVGRNLSNEIELRLRLGHSHRHNRLASSPAGTSVDALIKHRYATSLEARPLTDPASGSASGSPSLVGSSGMFVVDPVTKQLYTTAQLAQGGGEEFCVTPLSFSRSEGGDSDDNGEDQKNATTSSHTTSGNAHAQSQSQSQSLSQPQYHPSLTTSILNSSPLSAVAVASPGCVVWATHGFHAPDALLQRHGGGPAGGRGGLTERATIHISTRYADHGAEVPWAAWREDFGDWGTQTLSVRGVGAETVVWDARGCERGGGREGTVLLGTSEGVFCGEFGGAAGGGNARGNLFEEVGHRVEGGRVSRGKEAVCVAWKDERVWLAGGRDGGVRLGDVRAPGAAVARLVHRGAVCRVESLRPRCDWGVLVWGLQGSAVYDLRWTKDVPASASLSTPVDESEQPSSERGDRSHRLAAKPAPLTTPLYTFDIPPARRQRQYGMGFAFDAAAGVVAAAWPEALGQSRVGLWDVVTGHILESPLEKRSYGPVPCMQFVDLESDCAGAKTLLVAARRHGGASGLLEAWE